MARCWLARDCGHLFDHLKFLRGRNNTSAPDSVEDYLTGVPNLGPFTDVLVIHVSSPNTPGSGGPQSRDLPIGLLIAVVKERDELPIRSVQMASNGGVPRSW